MSDINLTCEETPLAWPASLAITDLTTCGNCSIKIISPQPGSLQVLTRRQGGGVGDGVNIEENAGVGADYRGQRYAYEEAILHIPGLHVFPGQTAIYPAEYHIHMRTMAAPFRYITLVIPVSHLVDGPGQDYFAAVAAQPDPAATRPTLNTLLVPGTDVIQYQGPDIRGRTADMTDPAANCSSTDEREFLLVLKPAQIAATNLERIPREGSLSTNPRDLPSPGVTAARAVARDRLQKCAVLAQPGILGPVSSGPPGIGSSGQPNPGASQVTCKPLKVVDGRDVVDMSGVSVDISTLLDKTCPTPDSGGTWTGPSGDSAIMFVSVFIGILIADWFFTKFLWSLFFDENSPQLYVWEPVKFAFFILISLIYAGLSDSIMEIHQNGFGSSG